MLGKNNKEAFWSDGKLNLLGVRQHCDSKHAVPEGQTEWDQQ